MLVVVGPVHLHLRRERLHSVADPQFVPVGVGILRMVNGPPVRRNRLLVLGIAVEDDVARMRF